GGGGDWRLLHKADAVEAGVPAVARKVEVDFEVIDVTVREVLSRVIGRSVTQLVVDAEIAIVELQEEQKLPTAVIKAPAEVVEVSVEGIYNRHVGGEFHNGQMVGIWGVIKRVPQVGVVHADERIEATQCSLLAVAAKEIVNHPVIPL